MANIEAKLEFIEDNLETVIESTKIKIDKIYINAMKGVDMFEIHILSKLTKQRQSKRLRLIKAVEYNLMKSLKNYPFKSYSVINKEKICHILNGKCEINNF